MKWENTTKLGTDPFPASKVGMISKLEFLTNLREAALFKNNTRLLAALNRVL